jgi:hypothetical protein
MLLVIVGQERSLNFVVEINIEVNMKKNIIYLIKKIGKLFEVYSETNSVPQLMTAEEIGQYMGGN